MLSLYRPFTSLFRDDFEREFAPFFNAAAPRQQTFAPAVDVVERGDAYLLKAEVPGVAPQEIELSVENDVLTLRGERKYDNEETRDGYRRVERRYGSFTRSFVLPKGTNLDSIEAKIESGVLTVTIPKVPTATPRKIEVKGAGLVDKAKKIFAKSEEPATA
jgi:HSP20 family protein